ncbi:hypothetical protein CE91St62_29220 [Lachnospiraceae bacterium]|uniref:helix-turn-helix domain-containing protein n=1 Tax=Extibacter sp. GGCC_0201 TaxID=2731209 RepID=UPI001AA0BD5F|nr:helix-turn-helix transcriptional regulator [Extibacter sp. GGCC_0201]MBO1722719.1 helix-turn-helix transcriptional regulator [Extibacter sp. GGCC_0201]BDF34860.1 hypothetical protein CE91St61_29350 [Lachnospiraceae bacterium]BDF38861.1 hypothetical protein CE91St62_29220 [Lachnospiraceae bacterium]
MENRIKRVGERIRFYRKQQKMTLETLAAKMNKSKATISKYENGTIIMDIETLYEFADVFCIPIYCLIDDIRKESVNDGHMPFTSSTLYFYIFKGSGNREITESYLSLAKKDDDWQITLYYGGIPDSLNKSCLVYIGKGFGTDTTFSFIVTNYQNNLDQMYFTASLPYINWNGYLAGFWVGLTFEGVTPICMKAVISENRMEDREALRKLLTVTTDELNYFKKRDKFLLRNEE